MPDPLDLAALIRPGDRIAWSSGTAEPSALLALLDSQLDRVPKGRDEADSAEFVLRRHDEY